MAAPGNSTTDLTTDKPRRGRRWIPLSLRMFIAILAIVFVGGLLWVGFRYYRQQQVVREILAANGTVEFDDRTPKWLSGWLGDKWHEPFQRIGVVRLPFSEKLDAEVQHLLGIRPFPKLYIEDGPRVDELASEGRLDELRELVAKHPLLLFARYQEFEMPSDTTLLHIAVREGTIDVQTRLSLVTFLLEQGLEVDIRDWSNLTPLVFARDPAVVKLLLDHGASVSRDGPNAEVLDHSVYMFVNDEIGDRDDWFEISQLLCAAGAECNLLSACHLNDMSRFRRTLSRAETAEIQEALRTAAKLGRTEMVEILVAHGVNLHQPSDESPITYQAIRHSKTLQIFIDHDPSLATLVNPYREEGWSLLHEAAQMGAVQSAQLLLDRGIPINVKTAIGKTPLDVAVTAGQVTLVKFFIEHRADLQTVSSEWITKIANNVLLCMNYTERLPELKLTDWRDSWEILVSAGAPQDLWSMITLGRAATVRQMIDANPELVNVRHSSIIGHYPLHWAVVFDQPEIVEILLVAGAEIDAKDSASGATALHWAGGQGRLAIAKILISSHADVNQRDDLGQIPLHLAARQYRPELVRLFLAAGAQRDAVNSYGLSPMNAVRSLSLKPTDAEERDRIETTRLLSEDQE